MFPLEVVMLGVEYNRSARHFQRRARHFLYRIANGMCIGYRRATMEAVLGVMTPALLLKRAQGPFSQGNAKLQFGHETI